jgi:uncharacterized protein YeaO (DUF488 family)
MKKGFEAAWVLLKKGWPKQDTLEDKIWKLWRKEPAMKSEELCAKLSKTESALKQMQAQYRKDIEKAEAEETRRKIRLLRRIHG